MMTQKVARILVVAGVVVAALAALTPSLGITVAPLSASARKGVLKVTKNCDLYNFTAGSFCTITNSSLPEIDGATVFYDQAANTPTGMLDSNVVVLAGSGNWAVGRCTLDLSTFLGVCTFSDGVGPLAGFHGRVDVAPTGNGDFSWTGTYSFNPRADRNQ